MSREGAQRESTPAPTGGTPIWVWLVYGLGVLGATILVGSALFALGASMADDAAVSTSVSIPALLLWGAFAVAALVLLLWRRGGSR
ncbi:MAG: hypothetical protein R6W48_12355 [Gaiellaceae bacterium]